VCLVLALDKIRRYLKDNGINTGPILVLSYKNHALDEFLLDVLHAHDGLNQGQLIRCGKSDTEELLNFTEKRHPEEAICQKELTRRVKLLRKVRVFAFEMWSCANHMESTFATESPWIPRGQIGDARDATFGDCKIVYQSSTGALVNALMWLSELVENLPYCTVEDAESYEDEDSCLILPSPDDTVHMLDGLDEDDEDYEGCLHYIQPISDEVPHVLKRLSEDSLTKWIKNLRSSSDHWNRRVPRDEQFVYILDQFLRGNSPPRRCTCKTGPHGEQCMESVDRNRQQWTSFCTRDHACLAPECARKRVIDKSQFCSEHGCKYDDTCGGMRHGASRFCSDHTCMGCLRTFKNPPKAGQPFACEDHKCQLGDCHKLSVLSHTFCEAHCCEKCLADGSPSSSPACNVNTKLCNIHKCHISECSAAVIGDSFQSCWYHKCIDCDAHVDKTCPDSHLCMIHKCLRGNCVRRRAKNSKYCNTHTCRLCVYEGCFGDSPVVDRNCCSKHLLCNRVLKNGRLCDGRAELPGLFCALHNDFSGEAKSGDDDLGTATDQWEGGDGRCWGIKKNRDRCKSEGFNEIKAHKYYCKDHFAQAPVALPVDFDEDSNTAEEENIVEEALDPDIIDWIAHLPPADYVPPDTQGDSNAYVKTPCSHQRCIHFSYQPSVLGPWRCPVHIADVHLPPPPPPIPPPGYGDLSTQGTAVGGEDESKQDSTARGGRNRQQANQEDNAGVVLAAAGL
jgi:hypothetical protein